MRLRIVRPVPAQLDDCDLSGLRFAATYDLNPPVSDLLIVLGYAVPVEEVIARRLNPSRPIGARGSPELRDGADRAFGNARPDTASCH